jgi:hypothetical protein
MINVHHPYLLALLQTAWTECPPDKVSNSGFVLSSLQRAHGITILSGCFSFTDRVGVIELCLLGQNALVETFGNLSQCVEIVGNGMRRLSSKSIAQGGRMFRSFQASHRQQVRTQTQSLPKTVAPFKFLLSHSSTNTPDFIISVRKSQRSVFPFNHPFTTSSWRRWMISELHSSTIPRTPTSSSNSANIRFVHTKSSSRSSQDISPLPSSAASR